MFDWMHRGKVERPESEFRLEYMAAQKAKEESARHSLQQLKAEIAATMLPAIVALSKGDLVEVGKCIDELWQLSVSNTPNTNKYSKSKRKIINLC